MNMPLYGQFFSQKYVLFNTAIPRAAHCWYPIREKYRLYALSINLLIGFAHLILTWSSFNCTEINMDNVIKLITGIAHLRFWSAWLEDPVRSSYERQPTWKLAFRDKNKSCRSFLCVYRRVPASFPAVVWYQRRQLDVRRTESQDMN